MTMQELPERRPDKIDLNLLPPEYLPKKTSKLTIIMAIAVVVLACVPWPFLVMKSSVDAENNQLQAELDSLNTEFKLLSAKVGECTALDSKINQKEAEWLAIQADWEAFQASIRTWSEIFYDVMQIPRGVVGKLNNITQKGDTLTIDGGFNREKYIYEYSVMLAETGHFIDDGINIKTKSYDASSDTHRFKIEALLIPVGAD